MNLKVVFVSCMFLIGAFAGHNVTKGISRSPTVEKTISSVEIPELKFSPVNQFDVTVDLNTNKVVVNGAQDAACPARVNVEVKSDKPEVIYKVKKEVVIQYIYPFPVLKTREIAAKPISIDIPKLNIDSFGV